MWYEMQALTGMGIFEWQNITNILELKINKKRRKSRKGTPESRSVSRVYFIWRCVFVFVFEIFYLNSVSFECKHEVVKYGCAISFNLYSVVCRNIFPPNTTNILFMKSKHFDDVIIGTFFSPKLAWNLSFVLPFSCTKSGI